MDGRALQNGYAPGDFKKIALFENVMLLDAQDVIFFLVRPDQRNL